MKIKNKKYLAIGILFIFLGILIIAVRFLWGNYDFYLHAKNSLGFSINFSPAYTCLGF